MSTTLTPIKRTDLQRIIQRLRDRNVYVASYTSLPPAMSAAADFTMVAAVKRPLDNASELQILFGFNTSKDFSYDHERTFVADVEETGAEIMRALTYPKMDGLTVKWDGGWMTPITVSTEGN